MIGVTKRLVWFQFFFLIINLAVLFFLKGAHYAVFFGDQVRDGGSNPRRLSSSLGGFSTGLKAHLQKPSCTTPVSLISQWMLLFFTIWIDQNYAIKHWCVCNISKKFDEISICLVVSTFNFINLKCRRKNATSILINLQSQLTLSQFSHKLYKTPTYK